MNPQPRDWFAISGVSMWPLASPLKVALDPVGDNLHIGDIVAIISDRPGFGLLHRVEYYDADRVILRGDTQDRADCAVARTAILGRLAAVKWGRSSAPWPHSTPFAAAVRCLGIGWGRVAPRLRTCLRTLRQSRANVDTRCRWGTFGGGSH